MKFIVDNIVLIFFVFYILVAIFGSTPDNKQVTKPLSPSYEMKEEYVLDDNINKEYKKQSIKQEIKRLEEEYENLEFDMSPSKLREWIRNEIRSAVQPK